MRRAVLLLLVLLPWTAAAQDTAPHPSLAVDPAFRDAPAGSSVDVTLVVANPTSSPLELQMRFRSDTGVEARFERTTVFAAPQQRTTVAVKLLLPEAPGRHEVFFTAEETLASAQAAGRDAPFEIHGSTQVRGMATALSEGARLGLRIVPDVLRLEPGKSARVMLVVRNEGPEIAMPPIEPAAPPPLRIEPLSPPERLPTGETRIPLVVGLVERAGIRAYDASVAVGDARTGMRVEAVAPATPTTAPTSSSAPSANALAETPPAADPPADAPASQAPFDGRIVAGAAIAGAAGVWTSLWLTRHKWWPLLLALYTRLRPGRILEHPVRRRIAEIVQERPGITFGELARALGIAPGQLTHHARMLEKAGVVFSSPDGQTRRFFHVGHGRLAPVASLADRAVDLVRERPRRAGDLARELGVSRQALHYHVKALVASGRLVARNDGRELWLEAPQVSSTASGLART